MDVQKCLLCAVKMDTQNVLSLYCFEMWNFLSCYLQLACGGLALVPWAKYSSRIFQFWVQGKPVVNLMIWPRG